ncbi:MAG: cob(I)yrinic acid a,c-diamide adenosyltransferase [Syntrophorhabdaceae bacterium]|nr:cob(I)yrinic acid a,c-diamide adenosyltransferase [Syntrophorhabdaceae bacterium]
MTDNHAPPLFIYGELETAKRTAPDFCIRPLGSGFIHVNPDNPDPADVQIAQNAWKACEEALYSEDYGMAILDEINNAIALRMLPVDDVLEGLKRARETHANRAKL